jgi:hypothetical protein
MACRFAAADQRDWLDDRSDDPEEPSRLFGVVFFLRGSCDNPGGTCGSSTILGNAIPASARAVTVKARIDGACLCIDNEAAVQEWVDRGDDRLGAGDRVVKVDVDPVETGLFINPFGELCAK